MSYYNSECLEGLYNLVKFANRPSGARGIELHFVSSVSASSAYPKTTVPEETLPADPRIALPMGYAQSKYIVEQLFDFLSREKSKKKDLRIPGFWNRYTNYALIAIDMPCFIYRVGQLCGDTTTGVWNSTEMYPLMMLGGATVLKKVCTEAFAFKK